MKIQVMSDIHLEFHEDRGQTFIRKLRPEGVDVLVLAGDIGTVRTGLGDNLRMFCKIYPQVVFVLGNHEYYGSEREEVINHVNQLKMDNFHWLNNTATTISGQRFIGGTLWFRDDPLNVLHMANANDFKVIPKFLDWVYDENRKSIEFLTSETGPTDIVITHHLPSWASVPRKYATSPLNRFYVCDMEQLILNKMPKMWIHGHTHGTCDYTMHKTRILCNPFGYLGVELNTNFNQNLVAEAS